VTAAARIRSSIRFRGRSFLALVLAPVEPLEDWFSELDLLGSRSPGFFAGRPVVLELTSLKLDLDDIASLLERLARRSIRVMAIEGAAPGLLDSRFPPPISGGRDGRPIETEPRQDRSASRPLHSLVLEQPVRSGQTVMHPAGDVIVLGAVSSGAEVIAGGSIHVYGALRGRAIAGTTGHAGARIFCRKLEAELLAIDGLYCTADTMDAKLRGRAAQAWLEGDAMLMAALD
jgi:septum site-determining protein MinC